MVSGLRGRLVIHIEWEGDALYLEDRMDLTACLFLCTVLFVL